MKMGFNSWVDLETKCPIPLDRIKKYYEELDSNLPSSIDPNNLNYAKERILEARSNLDSMFTTLIQILYDREILKSSSDKILFAWLVDNLGRYLRKLDEKEDFYIIKFDEPDPKNSRVGISRISAYSKMIRVSADSLIYESLLKSSIEYNELKTPKDKRTFLYILFQVIQVTMSVIGGMSREESSGLSKKGMINTIPTTWQSLMTQSGQNLIKSGYEQDTGNKLPKDLEKDLKELNESKSNEDDEDDDLELDEEGK